MVVPGAEEVVWGLVVVVVVYLVFWLVDCFSFGCFVVFREEVCVCWGLSLCSPGWPESQPVNQTSLQLRVPPASAS